MIGIRVWTSFDDAANDNAREILPERYDILDGRAPGCQEIAQLCRRKIEIDEILEPAV
jgi:hypothetical protein